MLPLLGSYTLERCAFTQLSYVQLDFYRS
jgi:hypothetical protein